MKPIYIYQMDDQIPVQARSEPTELDIEMVYCGPMQIIRISFLKNDGGELVADQMKRDGTWEPVTDYEYFWDGNRKMHDVPASKK